MLDFTIWAIVFVISLYALVKASDYFTLSALKIGLAFRLSAFVVGVTIVSVGTSLPELGSSIIAVLRGVSEIVTGNVVGSNIANIFLVIGISAIVGRGMRFKEQDVTKDLLFLLGSTGLFTVMIWNGVFSLPEALICLIAQTGYIIYCIKIGKGRAGSLEGGEQNELKLREKVQLKDGIIKYCIILFASSIIIYFSAKYTVESVIKLSAILSLGREVVAASAVALGTSLPELAVSVSAVRKGKTEVAIGNVIGSNIFNTLAVMGIPALFGALTVPASIVRVGLPAMVIATFFYIYIVYDREVTRKQGWIAVLLYIFFLITIFNLF